MSEQEGLYQKLLEAFSVVVLRLALHVCVLASNFPHSGSSSYFNKILLPREQNQSLCRNPVF